MTSIPMTPPIVLIIPTDADATPRCSSGTALATEDVSDGDAIPRPSPASARANATVQAEASPAIVENTAMDATIDAIPVTALNFSPSFTATYPKIGALRLNVSGRAMTTRPARVSV